MLGPPSMAVSKLIDMTSTSLERPYCKESSDSKVCSWCYRDVMQWTVEACTSALISAKVQAGFARLLQQSCARHAPPVKSNLVAVPCHSNGPECRHAHSIMSSGC